MSGSGKYSTTVKGDLRRNPWQRDRAEVLLEMAQQRISDALAVQHPAGDDHAADRAVGGLAEEQPDLGDTPDFVDPNRHRVDVDEGHVGPDHLELLVVEPAGLGIELVAHTVPVK
jgi:hypothetical protein